MSLIVVKQTKSVGIGILLTLFLGPIGLFYSSITGGLVMTLGPVVGLVYMIIVQSKTVISFAAGVYIFYFLFGWLVCIIWAVVGVSNYNRRITRSASILITDYPTSKISDQEQTLIYSKPVRKTAFRELFILVCVCILLAIIYKNYFYSKAEAETTLTTSTWTNQSEIDLFTKPSLKARIIGHVLPGASFIALQQTDYFIKVQFSDVNGKERTGYLQKSKLRQVLVRH